MHAGILVAGHARPGPFLLGVLQNSCYRGASELLGNCGGLYRPGVFEGERKVERASLISFSLRNCNLEANEDSGARSPQHASPSKQLGFLSLFYFEFFWYVSS